MNRFVCNEAVDAAFTDLKRTLITTPVLAPPAPKEPMLLYITASSRVVSIVLVVEREEAGRQQLVHRPVYYVNEVLSQSKQNYP